MTEETKVLREITAVVPPEVEAELVRLSEAIAHKQLAIAQSEADHKGFLENDARLVAVIREKHRLAAIPEPNAADYPELADWHVAIRKWRAERPELIESLARLQTEHERMVNERIAGTVQKLSNHQLDLTQLYLDEATVQHSIAHHHARQMAKQVDHFRIALLTAPRRA